MDGLRVFPSEVLNLIMEQLVIAVGIRKLLRLRTVNRKFDTAILQTICVSQTVDIDDPATPKLASRMPPTLRGKVVAVKSQFAITSSESYLSVVAGVNQALDDLMETDSEQLRRSRHETIAGAVLLVRDHPVDHKIEAQNVLSGAVILGNLPIIALLLQDTDVNGTTPYFHGLLTLAATYGHLDVVRYLLTCGARLDSVFSSWSDQQYRLVSLPEWQAQNENIRPMSLRVEPPSALRTAVFGGHTDIVHLLLHSEHRLPITDTEYLRAILAGAKAGRLDLIDALLQTIGRKLADFPDLENEMMWAAVRYGRKHVVQKLLDNGADINAFRVPCLYPDHSALYIASSLGNISMVHFLIERGAKINNNPNRLPIEGAALAGHEEVVELLLDHGADPSSALRSAAAGSQPLLIKYLLHRFPDLPFRDAGELGLLAMVRALLVKNLTAVTLLVEAGVDPNDDFYTGPDGSLWYLAQQASFGRWIGEHLITLGARHSGEDTYNDDSNEPPTIRDVRVSERTWEWVSKY
ncbi:hypothetical protein JX265_007220 [Neoarthrinium moseri]|uniref:Ankyrin n=1 Tax=Neoarthrinium moseri TaxID=1658444 RepID=A0A9P9WKS2_9PEZI|nr:hypothetical protein JX265_007220 [Neoarthrinium moseri]